MTISSSSYVGLMSPTSNISKSLITQNDSNNDSSLSIDELGLDEDQFLALDTNGDSLVTQDEIASAIDSKLSSFNGEMPSKDDFTSLLSDLGLQVPTQTATNESSSAGSDFSSLIMSQYDSNGDSSLTSDEVSSLTDDEFSALDANNDGNISGDELSSAFEQVTSANSNSGTSTTQSAMPSGGSSGASVTSSSEEYDDRDTNKDGVVSEEEKKVALGISTDGTTRSTSVATNQDTKDSIKLLLDTIKLNSQDSSKEVDLSSFKNIMKMMNNQSNNSDLNTYVSNLSTSTSSKFSYA